MGRPWRTPSPARSAYMSSSLENSPNSAPPLGSSSSSTGVPNQFARPLTPPLRNPTSFWHGLPSPNTPSFGDTSFKTLLHSLGRDETEQERTLPIDNKDDRSQHIIEREELEEDVVTFARESSSAVATSNHDEELARELDDAPVSAATRRSARIRKQVGSQNLSPTPQTDCRKGAKPKVKPAPAPAEPERPVPFELAITPAKADPIPFEGFPVLRSLDWELQYPPGGSTHPSYPYPTLDPLLIFCQPFVPVVDGLPDFSKVSKLVLPIGWRQVTWCGLLPVVFDPYHQAFKLTPAGPLPLTCEELHQGGLQKYVPGGELHPETGLLPDMMAFSDGSVDDVYNWEGVDWTLPWGNHESTAFGTAGQTKESTSSGGIALQISSVTAFAIVSPWREARDCPNMVLDLEDAWRWLSGKEKYPENDFVPVSAKRPRIGAYRTYRKIKSPIPELMMGAMLADPDETNPVLQNQDSKSPSKNNEFCAYRSVATPMHVNITLLADTEFTLMELLCYFPQHYNWRHAAERFARAGISPSMIRNIINMTRALEGGSAVKSSTVASATNRAKQEAVKQEDKGEVVESGEDGGETASTDPVKDSKQVTTNYTAEGWTYDVWSKTDYPLLSLAHGLQQLPAGPDAGPLTYLINWCRKNERYRVLLSEVPALLKEAGVEPLIEASEEGCPDKDVAPRHQEAMKKDFQRVKRSLDVMRWAAEDEQGSSGSKKRKLSDVMG
ncbi:hypothetical protein J1614_006740 [Plenodomus biglobosus]|nr:hypothetical protein J1614_006740 [Plenodomus biglobosus]